MMRGTVAAARRARATAVACSTKAVASFWNVPSWRSEIDSSRRCSWDCWFSQRSVANAVMSIGASGGLSAMLEGMRKLRKEKA